MDQNMNMGAPMTGAPMPEEKTSTGAIISIIVIVLVLALGALFFFKQVPTTEETGEIVTPAELQADATVSGLSAQGTSTDIADIERDLNATDFSGIDSGLSDIVI